MVHCVEPPPNPVIRNSFAFDGMAPNWMGAGANTMHNEGESAIANTLFGSYAERLCQDECRSRQAKHPANDCAISHAYCPA